ncbi:hypothetical protein DRO24_01050 [Candidatus Bathyarchaeota archaeon]|nr:MAG: hypothetical protein DRO24_01050 [Candidatus Bathyarchaeota archaeon]
MFDPLRFLDLAKNISKSGSVNPTEEATLRTAISRAYYAAHLHIRELLRRYYPSELTNTALKKEKISEHRKVRILLIRRGLHHIADKHLALFQFRVKADYRLHETVNKDDTAKSIQLAEDIIRQSNKYLK